MRCNWPITFWWNGKIVAIRFGNNDDWGWHEYLGNMLLLGENQNWCFIRNYIKWEKILFFEIFIIIQVVMEWNVLIYMKLSVILKLPFLSERLVRKNIIVLWVVTKMVKIAITCVLEQNQKSTRCNKDLQNAFKLILGGPSLYKF